jgi:hypothetical protein
VRSAVGVYWDDGKSKWACLFYTASGGGAGRVVHLGWFVDEVAAALAYDQAAREYHKDKAQLNFPEPPSQHQAASSDALPQCAPPQCYPPLSDEEMLAPTQAEDRACVGQVFVDPDDRELYLIQTVEYNETFEAMVCSYQRLESGGYHGGYSPVGEVHISTVGEVWAWLGATPAHVRHRTRLCGEGEGLASAVVSSPEMVTKQPGPSTPSPDEEGLWVRPMREQATGASRYVGES